MKKHTREPILQMSKQARREKRLLQVKQATGLHPTALRGGPCFGLFLPLGPGALWFGLVFLARLNKVAS